MTSDFNLILIGKYSPQHRLPPAAQNSNNTTCFFFLFFQKGRQPLRTVGEKFFPFENRITMGHEGHLEESLEERK